MLRHTIRALFRAPAFALATVVTLAIAIGATTAIFSVVDGVLLEPLPFPQSDRLVAVRHVFPTLDDDEHDASPAFYFTYRDNTTTFESVALWFTNTATVTGGGDPEEIQAVRASVEFLPTLRVEPLLGRRFTTADDTPRSPPTVMLSYGFWQRRFGGDRDVVGRTLTLDGAPAEIVGVLPPTFRFLEDQAEVLTPAQADRAQSFAGPIGERVIARLKDGATLEQASADVARMIPIYYEASPRAPWLPPGALDGTRTSPSLHLLKDRVVGDLDEALLVLMSTIGMLLLIACANIANLLLVRTESRRPELAIRAALGASSSAIARSLLLESAVLALAGGAVGLLFASLALPALLRLAGSALPSALDIGIDANVAGFAFAVSLLCGALLCLLPIAKHAAPRVIDALRGAGRSYSAGRESHRTRNTLVVTQVALALVLLIASGLMIRSFAALRAVDPGVQDPQAVQTFRIWVPPSVPDFSRVVRMQNDIADRIAAMPGVESVAFASRRPLLGQGPSGPFLFGDSTESAETEFRYTSPGFFATLGTPLLAGRDFDWTDIYEKHQVAIVSANIANARWGSPAAAVGKELRRVANAPPTTIVGVVGDVRHYGVDQRSPEAVYLTQAELIAQYASRIMFYFVRSERVGDPGFVEELQRAVWAVNPELPLGSIEPLGAVYDRSMARTSLTLVLLAITSGMALLLGLVGIYAVIAYVLSQRTRELGIRMALGARAGTLKAMLVRHVLALVAIGVALGAGGAVALSRFMESLLFDVTALDAATYVAVSGLLFAVALLAGYLPARRVTRIDPMQSLRAE
jgi:predicted permease